MALSLSSVRPATADEWDSTWMRCSYSTYFHSREWAEIWNVYTGGRTRPAPRLVTFSDGTRAVLPLSLQISHRGILRRYISSPAGTFGGWISADDLGLGHAGLLADYLSQQLHVLIWRLNPYDPLVLKAGIKNCEYDETHACNLGLGFDAVYKLSTKGHRSAARKALKEGVVVKKANTRDDWLAYYHTYQDSLRRWGNNASSKYGWVLFEEMFRRNSPYIKLWLAVYQETAVAGALCFYAPRHAVYWHGAALENYFHLRPVNMLIYEAIRDACKQERVWFDFNPSGGHEGAKSFKCHFGAVSLPAPVVWQEDRVFRVMALISKVARRLRV